MYLATGGGHIAAAKALTAECARLYTSEEVETHILNGIPENGMKFRRLLVEGGYRFSTLTLPLLWQAIYCITSLSPIMHYNSVIMAHSFGPAIRKYIRQHNITRIVNLHSFLISPIFHALGQLGRLDMPTITIVMDPYSCHPFWVFRQFHPLLVFSQHVQKSAHKYLRRYRMPSSRLVSQQDGQQGIQQDVAVRPIILNSQFNQALSTEACLQLREKYGFSRHKGLILMTGGGEGLPSGEGCLQAIVRAGLDVDIAFVCGKNMKQRARIAEIAKQSPISRVKVYGFIDFMYELMNMADIILTKAGPATIFETLMLQKPLIITQRIYGQEQGNVDFVVRNKLGWFIPHPRAVVKHIRKILDHPEIAEQVIQNIRQMGITNGTEQIVKHIMNLPANRNCSTQA